MLGHIFPIQTFEINEKSMHPKKQYIILGFSERYNAVRTAF
jgi:hypothetical protein